MPRPLQSFMLNLRQPPALGALAFPAVGSVETTTGLALNSFGGITVDRSWSRSMIPNTQWLARAAGFLDPSDANGVTVSLFYQKDNLAVVTLGSATFTGAGFVKASLGPFDVFGTGGVPTETIAAVRLGATKLVGGTAGLTAWTVWIELH
jgi:hypothetical protein